MTTKKSLPLIALILILTITGLYAQPIEPNQTEPDQIPDLNFEISETKAPFPRFRSNLPGAQTASYLVQIPVEGDDRSLHDDYIMFVKSKLEDMNSVSKEQINLILTNEVSFTAKYHPEENFAALMFYALSKQDAKQMTKAFLMYRNNLAMKAQQELNNRIDGYQKDLATKKQQLSEAEKKLKEISAKLEEVKQEHPYLTDEIAESIAADLNKQLIDLDIDIAGIEAKLNELQKIREKYNGIRSSGNYPIIIDQIDQILTEQNVALAGAGARKEQIKKTLDKLSLFPQKSETVSQVQHLKTGYKGLK